MHAGFYPTQLATEVLFIQSKYMEMESSSNRTHILCFDLESYDSKIGVMNGLFKLQWKQKGIGGETEKKKKRNHNNNNNAYRYSYMRIN